jgi:demethylmenaquinone methyltransferase/2-methoxy-6-polyprenyl-1,4-benzoquinol methylase
MRRKKQPTQGSSPQLLELMSTLSAPAITQAVAALQVPSGSAGLDAGCGTGRSVDLLLDRIGPSGRLTALDISEENLAWARSHRGQGAAVDWVLGDIRKLPFEDASFDWVWCSDTLWPGAVIQNPAPVLTEFRRVLKPQGTVALVYWSSQTLLPGYPVLEAKLNQAFVRTVPYLSGISPELHFLRASLWLKEAGFAEPRTTTFLAEIERPRTPDARRALAECYAMFWGDLAGEVDDADWELFERLCNLNSPEFIAGTPDYHAFLTYTMFQARVAKPK